MKRAEAQMDDAWCKARAIVGGNDDFASSARRE
jgi:hypothetical protein